MSLGDAVRAAQKPIVDALESPFRLGHSIEYEDLEADPDMRNRIVRWYYTRLKNEWLYQDSKFRSLARYFIIKDGKPVLVSSSEEYKDKSFKNPDEPEKNTLLKLDLIRKHLINKRRIARVLEKYASKTETKWWDLEDAVDNVKIVLYKELRRKILESIDAKISLESVKTKKPPSVIEDEASGEI
jgi:hypothetical protein